MINRLHVAKALLSKAPVVTKKHRNCNLSICPDLKANQFSFFEGAKTGANFLENVAAELKSQRKI